FSGQMETFLIVLIALITVLYQIDASIVNSTLNVKRKIIITFGSSFITIILAFLLIPYYNILGLLISVLIGISFLSVFNSYLVMKLTSSKKVIKNLYCSRLALFGIILLVGCSFISYLIEIDT